MTEREVESRCDRETKLIIRGQCQRGKGHVGLCSLDIGPINQARAEGPKCSCGGSGWGHYFGSNHEPVDSDPAFDDSQARADIRAEALAEVVARLEIELSDIGKSSAPWRQRDRFGIERAIATVREMGEK